MSHLGDTNKMVGDTPRTDARRGFHGWYTAVDAEFSEKLERELNAANDRIKRLETGDAALTYSICLDLQKENDALKQRIKRLEEAGNDLMEEDCICTRRSAWKKAKEAKL